MSPILSAYRNARGSDSRRLAPRPAELAKGGVEGASGGAGGQGTASTSPQEGGQGEGPPQPQNPNPSSGFRTSQPAPGRPTSWACPHCSTTQAKVQHRGAKPKFPTARGP